MSHEEKVYTKLKQHYHCAQAIFATYASDYGNFHIIGYARRGSKSAKAQQKNDNFARWGQKTAQSEKFKEKAEGKVEIQ